MSPDELKNVLLDHNLWVEGNGERKADLSRNK